MSYKIAVSKAHHIGKGGFVMRLTGGVPPQPKFYRCAVQEGDLVRLPSEVCQVLQVRTGHRVDFRILEDRVELFHAWPCCQLCGGSGRFATPLCAPPAWKQFVRRTCPSPRSPTMRDCGRDKRNGIYPHLKKQTNLPSEPNGRFACFSYGLGAVSLSLSFLGYGLETSVRSSR